jgi:hypothetical protein
MTIEERMQARIEELKKAREDHLLSLRVIDTLIAEFTTFLDPPPTITHSPEEEE